MPHLTSLAPGTHKFVPYHEKHAKKGSCVRCGRLPEHKVHKP